VLKNTVMEGTGKLNARSFLEWGTNVEKDPKKGDVVVISRGSEPWMGHVGFFNGFDSNGDIQIVGGNQGDAVSIKTYKADRLLGFRRADGTPLPVKGTQPEREAPNMVQSALSNIAPTVSAEAPAQSSAPETQSNNDLVESAITEAGAYRLKKVNAAEQEGDALLDREPSRVDAPSEDAAPKSVSKKLGKAEIAKMVDTKLTEKQKRQIRAAGYRPEETEFFETREEAEAAAERGEVEPGTLYVDANGNVWLLE
jgi:hypothetical protein